MCSLTFLCVWSEIPSMIAMFLFCVYLKQGAKELDYLIRESTQRVSSIIYV